MKKKLFCLLLIVILPIVILCVGCSKDNNNNSSFGQNPVDQKSFVVVDSFSSGTSYWFEVIVNKATKVMYLIDEDGAITVMVNPDGTPMIYQGELK